MARLDRCEICDYTIDEGASSIGVKPGACGEVRLRFVHYTGTKPEPQMLCRSCWESINDTLDDFISGESENVETPSAMSLWEIE